MGEIPYDDNRYATHASHGKKSYNRKTVVSFEDILTDYLWSSIQNKGQAILAFKPDNLVLVNSCTSVLGCSILWAETSKPKIRNYL